jgi:hypothetical protein
MINKIDFKMLLCVVCSFGLSFLTIIGEIQSYIPFSNSTTEMGFAFTMFFGGCMFLFGIKK